MRTPPAFAVDRRAATAQYFMELILLHFMELILLHFMELILLHFMELILLHFMELILLPMLLRALFGEDLTALRDEIGPHVARTVKSFSPHAGMAASFDMCLP